MENKFRYNLKALLDQRGIRAADLARASGVSPSVLSEWMAGRIPGNVTNLKRVADFFGTTIDELLFGAGVVASSPIHRADPKTIMSIPGRAWVEVQVRWAEETGQLASQLTEAPKG